MFVNHQKQSSVPPVFTGPYSVPLILSLGYEKVRTEDFLNILREHRIEAVVDVRQSAFSMRPDFRKFKLITLLDEVEIAYFHLKAAGNPFRRQATSIEECLATYHNYLSTEPGVVNEILETFRHISLEFKRLAVICYERCPSHCHRTIVLDSLAKHDFRFLLKEITDDRTTTN